MRRPLTPWFAVALLVALLALVSMGASCNDDNDNTDVSEITPTTGDDEEPFDVDSLASLDTSDLTRSEKRVLGRILGDLLSPCGDPVSVGRCAASESQCRKCVPAARYVLRLVTEGLDKSEIEEFYGMRYGRDAELEIDIEGAPVRGAPMAPITIVEFSDFECPYCGLTAPLIERIIAEHEGRVRMVFMQYPLDGHTHSMPAARASIAAGNQGKFWEMHDMLFENQRSLETEDIEGYAEELGLDLDQFQTDMASEATQRRIDADKAKGRDLDISGTPSIFVNGRRFPEGPRSLAAYIQEELDQ